MIHMKNTLIAFGYIVLIIIILALWMFSSWLFLFAPCSVVKEFWYLSHTPGRCISL